MEEQKRKRIHIVLEELIILTGLVGQLLTFFTGNFMQANVLLFFTNQSNWWMILVTSGMLFSELLAWDRKIPKWMSILHYMCVTSIMLTFLVFTLVLAPQMLMQGNGSYLWSVSNLFVHILVPMLSIANWLFFSEKYEMEAYLVLSSMILPLCYVCFVFIWILAGGNFGPGADVPYFFLDYEANGWFTMEPGRLGCVWWILLLGIGMVLMSALLLTGKKKFQNRKRNR